MTVTRERFLNDAAIAEKVYAAARREQSRMLKAFLARVFRIERKGKPFAGLMHNTRSIRGGVNVQGRAAQG